MTMSKQQQQQQHLLQIFKQLPPEQQQTLLAFAEFLHSRIIKKAVLPTVPQVLPRPPEESVVAAIKRLAQSYPMLDKAIMLNETSHLMTEHILHGRSKVSVIDDLEAVFARHYEEFIHKKIT